MRGFPKCRTRTPRWRSAAARSAPLRLRWRAKTKLASDGNHFEAELSEIAGQGFPACDDAGTGVSEPAIILDRGDGTGDREAIDGVGVETVLHPFQRFDQRSLADGKTNP